MTIWTVCLLGLALVVFVGVLVPVTDHRSKLWLLGYGLVVALGVGGLTVFYQQSSREGRCTPQPGFGPSNWTGYHREMTRHTWSDFPPKY